MKRITKILLNSFISILTVTGLLTAKNPIKTEAKMRDKIIPNVVDEFTIAGFINYYDPSIANIEVQTTDLARSGLNWIDTPLWYTPSDSSASTARGNPDILNYSDGWERFNNLCRELNIYFSMNLDGAATPNDVTGPELAIAAKNLERCIGYYIKDEPSSAQLEGIADICKKMEALDPTRFPYVNLYPNYAGAANLGGNYEDYVRKWVRLIGPENLEYLYFDHYPFTAFEEIRSTYFQDVETIRKVAYENGKIKTGGYTQMGYWNGMREPTIAEARWSMNSLLTYGLKSISHFCWVSPAYVSSADGGEGMQEFVLRSDGTPTKLYEPMQKLNWQTRQMGPYLMSFDVAHAYHTGSIPTGTEALPKSFIFQPSNKDDNLIFSYGVGKNNVDKYIILFNKELEGTQNYTIKVDPSSHVESFTWLKPNSFETLPDYTKELDDCEHIEIPVVNGEFNMEIEAGGLRLFKLPETAVINEPLSTPKFSLKSGTYVGNQLLEITSIDNGTDIYFTTDGSYPTIYSNIYKEPILLEKNNDFTTYQIQAICVRGDEFSKVANANYILSDASVNVAYKKEVTFTGPTSVLQGVCDASSIVDGGFDPWNTMASDPNTSCFAIVDFGDEYDIDKVVVKAWHEQYFLDVVLQIATDADFTQNVYTIYNNDNDNSVGAGIGTDGEYREDPSSGHTFKFEKRKARYLRFHNISAGHNRSCWEEIQAYSYYQAGTDLISDTASWQVCGGGTWSNNGQKIAQTGDYNHDTWDRAYSYTAKKYKNFVLDAKITMNISDPNAWGYVGFGLYRTRKAAVQSDINDGYYAAIEPRGRVLLWNGTKPELGPLDANVTGFLLAGENSIRIISYEDYISISVNNEPVIFMKNEIFNREAGYISIHAGLIPCEVSYLRILELDSTFDFATFDNNIDSIDSPSIAVDKGTLKHDVINQLPTTVNVYDDNGISYPVSVSWDSDNYDLNTTGIHQFKGTLYNLPNGLNNVYNLEADASVFVRGEIDYSEIDKLIAIVETLDSSNFTPESYHQLMLKYNAALDMKNNKFLSQSDIGVGLFQLYDAIYKNLESVVDRSELISLINDVKDMNLDGYTEESKSELLRVLDEASLYADNILSTPADIASQIERINLAKDSLRKEVKKVAIDDKYEKLEEPKASNHNTLWIIIIAVSSLLFIGAWLLILLSKKIFK